MKSPHFGRSMGGLKRAFRAEADDDRRTPGVQAELAAA
jgi:hypothetical protein